MTVRQLISLFTIPIVAAVGCAKSDEKIPTTVKNTSEVEISVGETKVEEPAPAEPAIPAASTPAAPGEEKPMVAAKDEPTATAKPAGNAPPAAAPKSSSPAHSGPAKFVGRVVVKGDAPKLAPLVAKGKEMKDAICSAEAVPDESVIVSADGGLANCFVYMKRGPKKGVPEPPADVTPVLDQKGCVFLPHAQIVRTGVTMLLKNSDPVAHNVHSLPFKNQGVNSLIPGNDETGLETSFQYAEGTPVRVVCDIHAWMTSYVLPVDHPWAAITDENGNFEVTDLPDGDWTFVVWHEKVGNIESKFNVSASEGKLIEQEFVVDAAKLSE